jgi:type I restriction-modification system DNA methylase subunit
VLGKFEKQPNRDEKHALREELVEAMELSPKVGRTCAMNLYLHSIGGDQVVVHAGHDSLAAPWSKEYTMILANPPFGKKQSLLFVNEEGDTNPEGRWRSFDYDDLLKREPSDGLAPAHAVLKCVRECPQCSCGSCCVRNSRLFSGGFPFAAAK